MERVKKQVIETDMVEAAGNQIWIQTILTKDLYWSLFHQMIVIFKEEILTIYRN